MNKNRFTLSAAAAIVLLPLGLAGVAAPAAAQPQSAVVAQASLIERFVIRPNGRIHAGDELRLRVEGAPRARVVVDVPGVASGILLKETRSGVYEGSYTVRRTDRLDAFDQAVATATRDGRRQVARVDLRGNDRDDRWRGDDKPPQIADVLPAQHQSVSERGRVRIAAKFDDAGRSGVDRDSVRLRVDGKDVTRSARITDDQVEYLVDLRPGRHKVELSVRDRAGNVASRDWSFDVRNDVPDPRPRVADSPLRVTSYADNALLNLERPLTLRGRTRANSFVEVRANSPQGALLAVQTVRADGSGDFVAQMPALMPGQASGRVELTLSARTPQGESLVERMTLRHAR